MLLSPHLALIAAFSSFSPRKFERPFARGRFFLGGRLGYGYWGPGNGRPPAAAPFERLVVNGSAVGEGKRRKRSPPTCRHRRLRRLLDSGRHHHVAAAAVAAAAATAAATAGGRRQKVRELRRGGRPLRHSHRRATATADTDTAAAPPSHGRLHGLLHHALHLVSHFRAREGGREEGQLVLVLVHDDHLVVLDGLDIREMKLFANGQSSVCGAANTFLLQGAVYHEGWLSTSNNNNNINKNNKNNSREK